MTNHLVPISRFDAVPAMAAMLGVKVRPQTRIPGRMATLWCRLSG
jgi:hypothetical protein